MLELTAIAGDRQDDALVGDPTPPIAPGTTSTVTAAAGVRRWRDLDRRGRWIAVLFAVALLLAPVMAFAWAAPRWAPANDAALMALRTLDVGTSRTPLTGQPSTSSLYGGGEPGTPNVDHLGPLHYYLMAVPVRVLGAALGMLVASSAITGASVVLAAWAVFRQLGPRGGVVAAVALGIVTYSTGATSLIDPVSSNIAGYPVLCSMVLLWCLLCGDLRLLPLTVGIVSFAAQQHLSVLPALLVAVVLAVGVVGVAYGRRLREPAARTRFARWAGVATAVGLVLWAPVLIQQAFGNDPNLSSLVRYTQDSDRPAVGWTVGIRPVVHVLAWPPILGRDQVTGDTLLEELWAAAWLSAGLVVVAVGAVGWWWWRGSQRRRAALAGMTAVVVLAGLVAGSSVPVSYERGRIVLYQWVWPLALLVAVTLGLAFADLVRQRVRSAGPLRPLVLSAALLAIAVPAMLNPRSDRRSNELSAAHSPIERWSYDRLGDQILAHDDELGDVTVILDRNRYLLDGLGQGLTVELIERGVDVRLPGWPVGQGAHADRVATRGSVDSGLVLAVTDPFAAPTDDELPGEHIATATTTGFDPAAFEELVAAVEDGGPVRLGSDLEEYVASLPHDGVRELRAAELANLAEGPRPVLSDPWVLEALLRYPPDRPRLDRELIRRVLDSFPDPGVRIYELDVYLLDHDELVDYASEAEVLPGRPTD